jgi:zinc D-Ala-D-Ala dipeptidase
MPNRCSSSSNGSFALVVTISLVISTLVAPHVAFLAQNGPPKESGVFRKAQLAELALLDPTLHLDIRYATSNNLTGRPVYDEPRAFLQRPAARALVRAHRALIKKGYGLLIFDGCRPWSVTKIFWDVTPPDKHQFVANPAEGSKHIDLSLYDLKTGREVEMPSIVIP